MKKWIVLGLLTICSIFSVSVSAWWYDFEFDGLYYSFIEQNTAVEVASSDPLGYLLEDSNDQNTPENFYGGAISVPAEVKVDNKTYEVTSIGECFLWNCQEGTEVELPSTIKSMGYAAFSAPNVVSVDLSRCINLKELGELAFNNCISIKSVMLPEGLTTIGKCAFNKCGLAAITIPKTVVRIKDRAFGHMDNMKSMTLMVENPNQIVLDPDIFSYTDISNCTLFVPDDAVELYKNAEQWKEFGQILPISEKANIESIEMRDAPSNQAYDLLGRRAIGKGVRIINGKKLLIK